MPLNIRQKLEKANQALTVQIKTISDAQKSAKAAEKKHAETVRNLKAREAELDKLRKNAQADKRKPAKKKDN